MADVQTVPVEARRDAKFRPEGAARDVKSAADRFKEEQGNKGRQAGK